MKVLSSVVIGTLTLSLAQTSSTMSPESPVASLSDKRIVLAKSQNLDAKGAIVLARLFPSLAQASQPRQLSFSDRVAYQRAIEEVYWRHRIWPKDRPDPKPSLDAVMPSVQLEKKVQDYLRDSQALEDYWQRPLRAEQLQAEMERMARHTKQPEVLGELFAALGNDPFVIAECLARPALAERLVTKLYARDQRFHGELRKRAETDLLAHNTINQMKQTSGMYTEMEFIKTDDEADAVAAGVSPTLDTRKANIIKINGSEWQERVEKLAAQFDSQDNVGPAPRLPNGAWAQIQTGVLSPLQEDDGYYYAVAVTKKDKDRLKLATVAWLKEPLRLRLAKAEAQAPTTIAAVSANYTLPAISNSSDNASPSVACTDGTWIATSNAPSARYIHTAVWTGSEMIVWGGAAYCCGYVNTGGRYNPGTDSWTATGTTNAPSARTEHTGVWTGSEMIVWGGQNNSGYLNTGGRYNPSNDTWTATSTTNAPSAREHHTAVWAASENEMIVWGGDDGSNFFNTGGRYNPSTDSWTATNTPNAPSARTQHTAVWTGSEMIVWGGLDNVIGDANTGARYNPGTDSWTPTNTTGAPLGRDSHTAVWTGSEMIVWGGVNTNVLNTGGRYNPGTNSWTATSTTNAPVGRFLHTAVWTGSEMIVWGGSSTFSPVNFLNSGGRYNPSMNSWTATSTTNAPSPRIDHTAVWTGSEMIIWGGVDGPNYLSSGGRYHATTDSWTATGGADSPDNRDLHTAVWTGSEMIVWGGDGGGANLNTGARYNPTTDSWIATSTLNAPAGRSFQTAVWTGIEMIIWGGNGGGTPGYLNTGGKYNPTTDSWIATSTTNAPSARDLHTAVWTGSQMIVWGGGDNTGHLNTGGRYNPTMDSWTATNTTNAPSARFRHTAVWTGSKMIVWGGLGVGYLNTGGKYDPSTDSWTATSTTNVPSPRQYHTAIWSGSEMIIWGGTTNISTFDTGGRYNPTTDSWTATNSITAPASRYIHTAIWTGNEMIVWGGLGVGTPGYLNTGGKYNPSTDSWAATSTTNAPSGRDFHTAVWTGSQMIVWGGYDGISYLNTGGRYCAQSMALAITGAASRKTHGGAGNFDVPLPLTGTPGIECRTGGATNDYTMVVTFSGNVTVTGSPQAQVTLGTGCVGTGGACTGSVAVSGNIVTIPLTSIANIQTINVRINGVNGPADDFTIPMSVLVGDTNGNRTVNAADVSQTKSRLGQAVNTTNFRSDVNANGSINAGDTAIVKQNSGTSLPP